MCGWFFWKEYEYPVEVGLVLFINMDCLKDRPRSSASSIVGRSLGSLNISLICNPLEINTQP